MRYLIFILLLVSQLSFSQEKEVRDITSYPNPIIIFNLSYNSFISVPDEMEVSPFSMGVDIYGMHTIIGKNNFMALAVGGGFSVQNIKSNSLLVSADSSYFQKLPDDLKYSKNKLATVFVDLPIELRFRSRPNPRDKAGIVRKRNFRLALGFKIGYNIQRYIKYDGEDYRASNYGTQIKFKEYRLKNVLQYRYGVYTRIGIGKVSLFAYYALTDLFEKNKGTELRPYSVGISIMI